MENQSKGSGREAQRWFESEAETAPGYWGGGLGAVCTLMPRWLGTWASDFPFAGGKAGPVCAGSQIMAGLWFKFGSSEGPPS